MPTETTPSPALAMLRQLLLVGNALFLLCLETTIVAAAAAAATTSSTNTKISRHAPTTTTTTTATTTTRRPLKSNTSDNASNNNETPGDHRRDFLVGLLVRTPLAVTARACAATPGPPGAVAATPPPIDDNASDRLLSETYGDVLELRGVGTGRERAIAACTGVDISPAAIDRARRRFETGGDDDPSPVSPALLEELYKNDKVRCFETGDDDDEDDLEGLLSSVGSEPQKFDVVVVVVVDDAHGSCLYPDPETALRRVGRVTKRGGKLLLLEQHRDSPVLERLVKEAGCFELLSVRNPGGGLFVEIVATRK